MMITGYFLTSVRMASTKTSGNNQYCWDVVTREISFNIVETPNCSVSIKDKYKDFEKNLK